MNLIEFEEASDEDRQSLSNLPIEVWESCLEEARSSDLYSTDTQQVVLVSNDAILVYDLDGNLLDLYFIRFPNEMSEEEE